MPVNLAERKFFELLEARFLAHPQKPFAEQTVEDLRANDALFLEFAGPLASGVSFKDDTIAVRDGHRIRIRILESSQVTHPSPVLFFYPGNGYVTRIFESNAIAASRIAKFSGIKVVVVDFRLTPEYPLPTSIEDAYDVTKFVIEHAAHYGIDPTQVFLSGISSGAHCAAVVSQMIRNNNDPIPILNQILINGLYDLTAKPSSHREFENEERMLTPEVTDLLARIWREGGMDPTKLDTPLYSPIRETHFKGLPPTTIVVGEYDGIRSQSEAYYQRLLDAEHPVKKIVLSGQTHNTMLLREAMHEGEDPAKVVSDIVRNQL